MEKEGISYEQKGIDAYVVPVSDDVRIKAAEITAMLRRAGISCDMDIMGRKMAKALKYASSARARFAIIVGKNELEQDSVTLRNMASGDQEIVQITELAGSVQG
jgi:histidyl-tRNA synthetase